MTSSSFSLSIFSSAKNIDARVQHDDNFFFMFLFFLLQKKIFTIAVLDKKFLFRVLSFNDSSSCDSQ